jgi:hypothetical protein
LRQTLSSYLECRSYRLLLSPWAVACVVRRFRTTMAEERNNKLINALGGKATQHKSFQLTR